MISHIRRSVRGARERKIESGSRFEEPRGKLAGGIERARITGPASRRHWDPITARLPIETRECVAMARNDVAVQEIMTIGRRLVIVVSAVMMPRPDHPIFGASRDHPSARSIIFTASVRDGDFWARGFHLGIPASRSQPREYLSREQKQRCLSSLAS
jgi:hypothetical protein